MGALRAAISPCHINWEVLKRPAGPALQISPFCQSYYLYYIRHEGSSDQDVVLTNTTLEKMRKLFWGAVVSKVGPIPAIADNAIADRRMGPLPKSNANDGCSSSRSLVGEMKSTSDGSRSDTSGPTLNLNPMKNKPAALDEVIELESPAKRARLSTSTPM